MVPTPGMAPLHPFVVYRWGALVIGWWLPGRLPGIPGPCLSCLLIVRVREMIFGDNLVENLESSPVQ